METKKIRKILEDFDFTEGEAKVYLSLLELGETKVGQIIKKSGISRSKVYDILDRLTGKNVVSRIKKSGVLLYQALPPNTLFNVIRKKEKELMEDESMLREILPQLMKLKPKDQLNITTYEGYEGFKTMIDKTISELTSKDVYEAMGISKTTGGMRFYAKKIYEDQEKKKFKARSIFDEGGIPKIAERKTRWHEMRVLPKGWRTPALFTIYGDTVGIHLGEEDNIISIVIKSKEIVQSFRETFKAMWKISKEVK